MWKNISELVKVKTLVTLTVVGVFAYLSIAGKVPVDSFMLILTSIISFYFGTQHEKSTAGGKDKEDE